MKEFIDLKSKLTYAPESIVDALILIGEHLQKVSSLEIGDTSDQRFVVKSTDKERGTYLSRDAGEIYRILGKMDVNPGDIYYNNSKKITREVISGPMTAMEAKEMIKNLREQLENKEEQE